MGNSSSCVTRQGSPSVSVAGEDAYGAYVARVPDRNSRRLGDSGPSYSPTGTRYSASSTSVDSDLDAELRFPINFSKAGTPRAVVHPAHEAAKEAAPGTAVLLKGQRKWSTYYVDPYADCPDKDPIMKRLRDYDATGQQRSIDRAMDAISLLNSSSGLDEVVCYSVLDGDYVPDYKGAGYLAYSMENDIGSPDWLLVQDDSHGCPLTPNNLCQLMLVLQNKSRNRGLEYLAKHDLMGRAQPLPADSLESAPWPAQFDAILNKLYEHASIVLQGDQKALMISLAGIGHELGANGVTVMDPATGQCLAVSSLDLADVIQRRCAPALDERQSNAPASRRQSTVSAVSVRTKNLRMRAQLEAVYGRDLAEVVQQYYLPESDAPQSSAPVSRRPSIAAGAGTQTESVEKHDGVGQHLADVPLRHDSPGEAASLTDRPASPKLSIAAATSAEIEVMDNSVPDYKGAGYLAYLMESDTGELDWLVVADHSHAQPLTCDNVCLLALDLQDMNRDQGLEFLKYYDGAVEAKLLVENSLDPASWLAQRIKIREMLDEQASIAPQPGAVASTAPADAIQQNDVLAQDALPSSRPALRRQSMVEVDDAGMERQEETRSAGSRKSTAGKARTASMTGKASVRSAASTSSTENLEGVGQSFEGYLIHYLPRTSQVNTGYLDEV